VCAKRIQGGAQNQIFYKLPVCIYIKVETDDAFNYVLSRRKGNINDITLNKKVSYRKQIAGQHLWPTLKKFPCI